MAPDLVGCRLIADPGGAHEVEAEIVEVEAYLGLDDPASHAFRGPTPRAAIMFGEPGRLYVYLSYGLHFCANVVTEPEGTAGAVLLRAAAVLSGEATVRERRSRAARRRHATRWLESGDRHPGPVGPRPIPAGALLRGPGNLCRGLGIARGDDGLDVCADGSRLRLLDRPAVPPLSVGPRVGIRAAADRRLRFAWQGHPAVSRPQPWTGER